MQANVTIHVMHERPLMRAGLAAFLQSNDWLVNTEVDYAHIAANDVIVADYDTGLQLSRWLQRPGQMQQVLIVTRCDKVWDVKRALDLCAGGYVLEDADATELQRAARLLLTGSRYVSPHIAKRISADTMSEQLTRRERDVLELLAKGLCNKHIARDLGIEVGTVKFHVRGVMSKLGARARMQAVINAAKLGIVGIETAAAA